MLLSCVVRSCALCCCRGVERRKKSILLNELVYDKNTILPFSINGELSKINFTREKNKKTIKIKTIKLEQLLYKCKAPRVIDYFSLDSEGVGDKYFDKICD